MEAVGAGVLENTSMVLKSVWVDSVEVGPREVVGGGGEGESRGVVVERARAWLRMLVGEGECGEKCLGGWGGFWRRGRVDRIIAVALRARRRGMLGAAMFAVWRSGSALGK